MQINIFMLQPLVIISVAAIFLMLAIAIKRNHTFAFVFTSLSLVIAFLSLFEVSPYTPVQVTPLLIIDNYSIFYMGLIFSGTLAITLLSFTYNRQRDELSEEYYILLILSTLGAAILSASQHFVSFFLGLEMLSIPLYALIAYMKTKEQSIEAGLKYVILAGVSSAFLLFGMALIYAQYGTMEFGQLAKNISTGGSLSLLALTGFGLMIVGVGFKLSVAPFHMWASDVYEGSPAPVSAFIATVSKGGMFAVWLRFFTEFQGYNYSPLMNAISVIAIASMFIGNILALLQRNVKRILAYSSISNLGYILVSFLAGGQLGVEAATFYFVAYFITIIGAFGIVTILSVKEKEADDLEDYLGLFWRRPFIATVFSAMILSLAGIPLTAGFIGKFYVVAAGINSSLWNLAIFLVINSAIGIYYYLKIVAAMYAQPSPAHQNNENTLYKRPASIVGAFALSVLSFLLIYFGVYPSGIMELIRNMV